MKIALRVLLGLLVVAFGAGHWFLFPNSAPFGKAEASLISVSVDPLPLSVFCPGAFVEVGGPTGVELGSVTKIGEALISSQSSEEELLVAPPVTTVLGVTVTAQNGEQSTNLLSVMQAQAVSEERAQGLAASYCQQPVASGWLINGSAVVGQESVLIAANPSEVEALVELEIHLPNRIISDRFALAPFEEQLIPTAGYANGEASFAVFFESSGPAISMALQNRETRGLNPTGIELEGVTQNPSTDMVFVGLRPLTDGFENPTMRIYNPGVAATEVIITAFGDDNIELFRVNVNSGSFAEVDLSVSGSFQLVTLSSAEPVLAAIKNPSLEPILDFAWLMPAELFSSVTVPLSSYQNTLVLANPGTSAVEITLELLTSSRSTYQSLVIPALGEVAVPVSGKSARIDGSAPFAVALELLDSAGYSIVHPTESRNLGRDLSIRID